MANRDSVLGDRLLERTDEGPLSAFKEIEDEIMYEARADTATHRMEDVIREFQSEMGAKVAARAEATSSKLKKTNLAFFDAVTKVLADHMTHMQLLEFKQKLREMHSSEVEVLSQVRGPRAREGMMRSARRARAKEGFARAIRGVFASARARARALSLARPRSVRGLSSHAPRRARALLA